MFLADLRIILLYTSAIGLLMILAMYTAVYTCTYNAA